MATVDVGGPQRIGVCVPEYAFTSIKSRIQHNAGKKAMAAAGSVVGSASAGTASNRKRKLDDALTRVAAKRMAALDPTDFKNEAFKMASGKILTVTPSGSVFEQH